ncbi:MAG: uracil-DNA glycosylase family protein [Chitinophagales bacterium]
MQEVSTSTFAERVISFYSSLQLSLPSTLQTVVLNPYREEKVMDYVQQFFRKYCNDHQKRTFIFGINPGRFGSGATGISFTDPVALRDFCGIENNLGNKRELSSEFIYKVIAAFGGSEKFYRHFFITATSPLGFMKGTKNYNYYDDKKLQEAVTPFIRKTWKQQIALGAKNNMAICIGCGKNKKMLETLNADFPYFEKIISLEHPRFIMQYRRKKVDEYVEMYLKAAQDL